MSELNVPAKWLVFPVKLNVNGEDKVCEDVAELSKTLNIALYGQAEIKTYNELIGSKGCRLRSCMRDMAISSLEELFEYTQNIIPELRNVGEATHLQLLSINPDLRLLSSFSYPLKVRFRGADIICVDKSDFSSILLRAYRMKLPFELVAESTDGKPVSPYPSKVMFAFSRRGISNIDDYVSKINIIPVISNIGAGAIASIREQHPNCLWAQELKYPLKYTIDGIPHVAKNKLDFSITLLDCYLNGKNFSLGGSDV